MGRSSLKPLLLIVAAAICSSFAVASPIYEPYDPKNVDSWVSYCSESTWGVSCDLFGGKDFARTRMELPPSCRIASKFTCANMSICDLKKWVRITDSPEPCKQAKAIRCPGQNADYIFRACRYSCNRSQSCLASCVENTGCTISW